MTVRSVIISLFIVCVSFGMTLTNTINDRYQSDTGRRLIETNITPYLDYDTLGIAYTRPAYNNTMNDMTTYNKPPDASSNLDLFQALKYGGFIIGFLFNSVFGFFYYLSSLGLMDAMLAVPLTIMLVINHILAVIYIVTGRTFIY